MTKTLFKFLLILSISGLAFFRTDFVFALSSPILISPTPDATNQPLSVVLDWGDVPGAEQYELGYIKTTQLCASINEGSWEILTTHPAESNFTLTGLVPDNGQGSGRYCWKIKAQATGDESNWSEKRAFTTMQITPPPGPGPNPGPGPSGPITPPIAATTLGELFDNIINFLFYVVLGLVPLMIIWAGLLIASAAGKAEQVNKGKTIILWSLMALAIVLLAKGLPSIIKSILGG